MTVQEMHLSFKQGLDKFDSKNYPNLLPEEIDLILNQAQDAFIKQRYGLNNPKQKGFEESQKRIDDLRSLIKTEILNPLSNNSKNINSNAVFVELPADYWITIQELTNITYTDCGSSVTEDVYTLPIQHNDYSKLIHNPFGKPTNEKILRLTTEDGVELLYPSGATVNNYRLRYIKRPQKMNIRSTPKVDCELPEMVHQEIVNLSISMALENIEAQRLKNFIQVTENRQE